MSKIVQPGGILCRLLGPVMKVGLPLMKSVLKLKELPLAKGVLIPIGSTAAASGTDTGIYKKNSWIRTSYGLSTANDNNGNFKWRNWGYHENT